MMGLLGSDFKPIKCPKCLRVAMSLITEQIPTVYKKRYPQGICRRCKKKIIKEFRRLLK